ncbi:MAG: membrane dipeptidase [Acidobacteria bacterium]|nr:membrane dipeptidase [Acidobacteriota bacterium]
MRHFVLLLALCPALLAQRPALHDKAFVMDGHVHVMTRELLTGVDFGARKTDGHVDLPRMIEGGLDAVFFSVYTPEPYYPSRHEVKNTLRVLSKARDEIDRNSDSIELALTASDIERINKAGKVAAFLDLEGSFDMEGDLDVLRGFYRLGLRSMQLTAHNVTSDTVDSCCDIHRHDGVSEVGKKLIAEMNRLGMVINVAHASNDTILQTVALSKDPVLYTHGGFRHVIDIPRLISDEAAKAIAAKGGVIGLQFGNTFNNPKYYKWKGGKPPVADISTRLGGYANKSIKEIDAGVAKGLPFVYKGEIPDEYRMTTAGFAKVIDYGVRLVGEDHIALGSDFDGGPPLPQGMEDISDYPEMTKAMIELGYSESRIRKILGLNLLRVIREVTEK